MESVRKRDGRSLDHKALEDIRIQAVQRVEAGEAPSAVMRVMGFARTVIYDWLNKYRAGGIEALRALPIPGRPTQADGAAARLGVSHGDAEQPAAVAVRVRPLDAGDGPRPDSAELRRDPEPASVGRLLRSLGLTPQRPVRRAIEQVPAKVREWLTVDYPAIQAKARKAGAQIFFADEAGVRSNSHHSGTTWAPMGQTPVVPATGKRFGLNLVSAVSPQGVLRFMVVDGRMTAVRFIAFLKRLLHNQTQPIFLIVDQHSSHRAKAVQEFVASTDGHLELFFLPPYSPELNPDELVWNHLKTHGVRKRLLQTPQELKRYVLGHMRSLQRTPALLRGFFKKPSLRYITA
jgi:transposase